MSTLLVIPTQTIPNQTVSTTIGNQTITVELITTYDERLYATVYIGSQVIYNTIPVVQGQYLIPYLNDLNGYLFIWNFTSQDAAVWTDLGVNAFLYYSDYDILNSNYEAWVQQNLAELIQEFGYL